MDSNGFDVALLPVDSLGRVVVEDLAAQLAPETPSLVHLTVVPSHRGIVQPLPEIAGTCREYGVPLVVDAAQGLGHVDCVVEADAIYGTSRKWLAGPRGVGVLAVRRDRAATLRSLANRRTGADIPPLRLLELGEANIAARVGFSSAISVHMELTVLSRCAPGLARRRPTDPRGAERPAGLARRRAARRADRDHDAGTD